MSAVPTILDKLADHARQRTEAAKRSVSLQDMKKMAELDDEIDEIHNKIHALEEKWEEAMLFEEEKNK